MSESRKSNLGHIININMAIEVLLRRTIETHLIMRQIGLVKIPHKTSKMSTLYQSHVVTTIGIRFQPFRLVTGLNFAIILKVKNLFSFCGRNILI